MVLAAGWEPSQGKGWKTPLSSLWAPHVAWASSQHGVWAAHRGWAETTLPFLVLTGLGPLPLLPHTISCNSPEGPPPLKGRGRGLYLLVGFWRTYGSGDVVMGFGNHRLPER